MSILKQLKKLGKDTFSYGFSSALQKLITIFLFPIYARLLTPEDFGIQDVIQTTIYIVTLFLILGLDSSVMMYYYEADERGKTRILSTYLWFEILVSFPVAIALILNAEFICSLILNDAGLAPYFQVGVAAAPFALVTGVILTTLRVTFQTKKFVILTTAGVLFQISFAILLVMIFKMGVMGVMVSVLISNVLQALLGAGLTYKNYILYLSREWTLKLLKLGVPLIPAALSFWIMSYANRFFLVDHASLEDIGLLSIVNRVGSILLLFLTAFSSAWGPYAYSLATKPEEAKKAYGKILTYFTLFSMSAALVLSMFSRELILVLATSVYEEGSSLVMAFCLSSVIWSGMYIVGMGTGIAKKNYHYTLSVIFGALANTGLNFLLIPPYGIAGAIYSTLAGNIVALVYIYFAGQHYFKVRYEHGTISLIILIVLLATVSGIWLDSFYENWTIELSVYKFSLLIAYCILLLLFRLVSKQEISKGLSLVRAKLPFN